VAARPFDWTGFLNVARELCARGDEAYLRTSISRAYYYVYNIALIRAEQNGFRAIQGESTHIQLWRLFNQNPEPECVRLGEIANRLKERREKADYRSTYLRIQEEAKDVLEQAHDFARRLEGLATRHPSPSSVRR